MIRKVTIENFKSIDRLELDLGRVNIFIGENGCGKSNILEAISFGAAAAADKLDHEFLVSRGIRVTDPKLMRSAFDAKSRNQPIRLAFDMPSGFLANLNPDDTPYPSWRNTFLEEGLLSAASWTDEMVRTAVHEVLQARPSPEAPGPAIAPRVERADLPAAIDEIVEGVFRERTNLRNFLFRIHTRTSLPTFLTYTPQLEALRTLDLESSIAPIGIHGEGLFKLLQVLEQEGHLPKIKAELEMIDWFADLEVFSGPNPALRALRIRDQYLDSAVAHFDQRSANEGFLFLLLYACLLVSKYTPAFFAVDNIETGLNPKLCAGLIAMFARLTRAHDKQVLLTTHNPGTLDGLDLNDDEQRLFVVYRNIEGGTRVRRIERQDLAAGEQPLRLSEAFLRGYIGGLPTNF